MIESRGPEHGAVVVDGCCADAHLVVTVSVEVSRLTCVTALSIEREFLIVSTRGVGGNGVSFVRRMAPLFCQVLSVPRDGGGIDIGVDASPHVAHGSHLSVTTRYLDDGSLEAIATTAIAGTV